MTAISRRSNIVKIPASVSLADADDLDGTTDNTQAYDVTGVKRLLIAQIDAGTPGTAGIDVIEISKDGGTTWSADTTLLALASDDNTGTVVTSAALNAAGIEPTGKVAIFKSGPHEGPTYIRCGRKTTTTGGTTWVTGAPSVILIKVGS